MSDEDQRRLERESRYHARLEALLECMKSQHKIGERIVASGGQISVCSRCGLLFSEAHDGLT